MGDVCPFWSTINYCRLLESESLANNERKADMDLCCIDVPFDEAWFLQRRQYWVSELDFEVRARQMHSDLFARVSVGWQIVEHFAARRQDRPIPYIGFEFSEWSSLASRWLLGVPTPLLMAYYSLPVLRLRRARDN